MNVDIDQKKQTIGVFDSEFEYTGYIQISFQSPDGTDNIVEIKKTVVNHLKSIPDNPDEWTREKLSPSRGGGYDTQYLRGVFSELSGIPEPLNYALVKKRWVDPINQIMDAVSDEGSSAYYIKRAINDMRGSKRPLTISSPASIVNVVLSLYGADNTGGKAGGYW